jgi:hypothetical protein
MVFESVAAHLIDKYLGDYIENLDAKKLKIDLWNGKNEFFFIRIHAFSSFLGNVVLENLNLKSDALVNLFK